MAAYAEDIPERHGAAAEGETVELQLLDAFIDFRVKPARLAEAGQIALHVGHEHRHAHRAELLGQHLQRHGLARAGRAGDEAVAVGHLREQENFGAGFGDANGFRRAHNFFFVAIFCPLARRLAS